MRALRWMAWVMLSTFLCGYAHAQNPAADVAPQPRDTDQQRGRMVEWVTPPLPANKPQTDAEAEAGRRAGRPLPVVEILQPPVDRALPVYQRRRDVKLKGSFKGAASDVLPGLVNLWIEAFQR